LNIQKNKKQKTNPGLYNSKIISVFTLPLVGVVNIHPGSIDTTNLEAIKGGGRQKNTVRHTPTDGDHGTWELLTNLIKQRILQLNHIHCACPRATIDDFPLPPTSWL
jgi:hypothetical protein